MTIDRLTRLTTLAREHARDASVVLARSVTLQRIVVGFGVAALGLSVCVAVLRLERTIDSHGRFVTVFVTTTAIDAGEEITSESLRRLDIPAAYLTANVLRDVAGVVAAHPLQSGDVLTTSNTTRSGAMAIPDGWRGITIDAGGLAERLVAGTTVDVMANGAFLVEGALVIAVAHDDRSVLIAVPHDVVVEVADAATLGVAVLAIAG
ncbi:MAG: SAF domain-containing protein [Actinomycetota bacterium]